MNENLNVRRMRVPEGQIEKMEPFDIKKELTEEFWKYAQQSFKAYSLDTEWTQVIEDAAHMAFLSKDKTPHLSDEQWDKALTYFRSLGYLQDDPGIINDILQIAPDKAPNITESIWKGMYEKWDRRPALADWYGHLNFGAEIKILFPQKSLQLTDEDWENTKKFLASSILRVMDFPVRAKAWRAARILWPGRREEFGISPQDRVRMVKELHRKKAFNLDSLQLAADIKVILADDIRITKEHGLEALRRKDSYAEGVAAAPPILEV